MEPKIQIVNQSGNMFSIAYILELVSLLEPLILKYE